MTEEELQKKIDHLLDSFESLPEVKRHRLLKKAVQEDSRLQRLLSSYRSLQTEARRLPLSQRKEKLRKAQEAYLEYENDPLVVNLKASREEILALLSPLSQFHL